MLIKLQLPFFLHAKRAEKKLTKPVSFEEKVRIDRLVIAFIFLSSIVATILFS